LALEQPEASPWGLLIPGAEPLFSEGAYLERYGFISSAASPYNPDGLPIGFASTIFQNIKGYPRTTKALGFTCAACHTGRFIHEDTEYVVQGGPATIDLQLLAGGLGAALGQTFIASKLPTPNARFDRFAKRVLGETYSLTAKEQLASELESVLVAGADASDTIDVVEGFGRLDALNRIGNQVFANNVQLPENYKAIDAPVNFPHIWTASWFDWVQYDGSIMQPLVRNAGEALGVHAAVNMTAPKGEGQFASAIPFKELNWIETTMAGTVPPTKRKEFGGLLAPKWPAALGAIDELLVEKGAALYDKHCKNCHLPALSSPEIWDEKYFRPIEWRTATDLKQSKNDYLALKIIDLGVVGTDSAQADILSYRTVNTAANPVQGQLAIGIDATVCAPLPQFAGIQSTETGYNDTVSDRSLVAENALVPIEVKDGPMLSFALALGALVQQTNDEWLNSNNVPDALRDVFEGDRPNCLQAGAGYKARPLNGIWATAPFLHNGSVATLDDLLRPADERPRFVQLGDLRFDAQKVGLAQPELTDPSYPPYQDGLFIMDTSLPGNLNKGHSFGVGADGDTTGVIGPNFTPEDRAALIEYLKTL
jgi:mono/diheme cytochrome c family protein